MATRVSTRWLSSGSQLTQAKVLTRSSMPDLHLFQLLWPLPPSRAALATAGSLPPLGTPAATSVPLHVRLLLLGKHLPQTVE